MNSLSAILRIVSGAALIILSYTTYNKIGSRVAAGEPLEILGFTTGASSNQLTLAFSVIGVIGVLLVILGMVTLFRKVP